MGLLRLWCVHRANVHDRDGGKLLLDTQKARGLSRTQKILLDAGYRGKLEHWIEQNLNWEPEVVQASRLTQWVGPGQKPQARQGFEKIQWRWIVERTFAWMCRYRRLSKDYEHLTSSSEAWMLIAMSSLMIRRIEPT